MKVVVDIYFTILFIFLALLSFLRILLFSRFCRVYICLSLSLCLSVCLSVCLYVQPFFRSSTCLHVCAMRTRKAANRSHSDTQLASKLNTQIFVVNNCKLVRIASLSARMRRLFTATGWNLTNLFFFSSQLPEGQAVAGRANNVATVTTQRNR